MILFGTVFFGILATLPHGSAGPVTTIAPTMIKVGRSKAHATRTVAPDWRRRPEGREGGKGRYYCCRYLTHASGYSVGAAILPDD